MHSASNKQLHAQCELCEKEETVSSLPVRKLLPDRRKRALERQASSANIVRIILNSCHTLGVVVAHFVHLHIMMHDDTTPTMPTTTTTATTRLSLMLGTWACLCVGVRGFLLCSVCVYVDVDVVRAHNFELLKQFSNENVRLCRQHRCRCAPTNDGGLCERQTRARARVQNLVTISAPYE